MSDQDPRGDDSDELFDEESPTEMPSRAQLGRALPHSIDAELAVLAALLIDNRAFEDPAVARLSEDDFYREKR